MKKIIITIGTLVAATAPIVSVVACGPNDNKNHENGIFTEYVRSHDLMLSLGVAPAYHARSDISSTHDLTNEGYLEEFSNSFTLNGKRYNGGDREYFSSLKIGAYIARSINDSKGYFTDVDHKIDVANSDAITDPTQFTLNWKTEMNKVAKKLDEYTSRTKYSTRAQNVLSEWAKRETKLKSDAHNLQTDVSVLVVRGTDDDTIFDSVIPDKHLSQLYGLEHILMPSAIDQSKLIVKSYQIIGKTEANRNEDLKAAYAGTATKIIYLKTPKSTSTDSQAKDALKTMTKTGSAGDVLVRTYDEWYLPFRGAAIGANVTMDNIENDIIKNTSYTLGTWKTLFNKDNLENLTIG